MLENVKYIWARKCDLNQLVAKTCFALINLPKQVPLEYLT